MRRRLLTAAAIVTLTLAVPALGQTTTNPAPPLATSGAATSVTTSGATIPGSVDPNGAATTYRVEYGTTTAYGLTTSTRDAGDGDDPVAVSVALTGLTSDTTYHYRVVATNAAGTDRSADRTLRTAAAPRPLPPVATTGPVRGLAPRAVTLTGTVDPRGLATRYRFEYGTETSLNRATSYQAAGSGSGPVAAAAALTLTPNTRYSYRLLATSFAGTVRGARRSFTSPRAPAALTFDVLSNRVPYEGTVVLSGSATSAGAGRVRVELRRQLFPFTGPFRQVGSTVRSASNGAYRFTISPLLISARFRVVARTSPAVTSVARTVRSTVRVGLTARRVRVRRVQFSGFVRPRVSGARASLQRRARGRFVTLRRVAVRPAGGNRSSYRMTIRARRSAAVYRVIVTPPRASGHVRGVSRTQVVAGLRRR